MAPASIGRWRLSRQWTTCCGSSVEPGKVLRSGTLKLQLNPAVELRQVPRRGQIAGAACRSPGVQALPRPADHRGVRKPFVSRSVYGAPSRTSTGCPNRGLPDCSGSWLTRSLGLKDRSRFRHCEIGFTQARDRSPSPVVVPVPRPKLTCLQSHGISLAQCC
jgi:hypothetical protein